MNVLHEKIACCVFGVAASQEQSIINKTISCSMRNLPATLNCNRSACCLNQAQERERNRDREKNLKVK